MSGYTPPASGDFADGQALDAAKTLAGFTDFAAAINGTVNGANLTVSGEIDATRFQSNGIRIVADVRNESQVEPMLVVPSNSTSMFGARTNIYDAVGTGCRFYLHAVTPVFIRSRIHLLKGKHSWATAGAAPKLAYIVTPSLVLNGTAYAQRLTQLIVSDTTAAAGANRGTTVEAFLYVSGLAVGAHTVHMKLDWSASTYSGGASDENGAEWFGTGSRTVVVAPIK